MMERRFESRFLCADLVRVDWSAGVNARTLEAVLEDISAVGACVQVEERIRPGTEISIAVDRGPGQFTRLSGEVSYCVFRDYGYFVGIRFSGETRWSSRIFEPRHLTNLQTLLAS
ncbi:MAG TPA: PilZ domain-containing protein [Bryobacteraceae bacterium]|jgi:hypothetical protein